MDAPLELELTDLTTDEYQAQMTDAIDNAADQDNITWLVEKGKRVAAVVPVDVAARYEEAMTVMVSGRHHGG
jgi:hypothetical protein